MQAMKISPCGYSLRPQLLKMHPLTLCYSPAVQSQTNYYFFVKKFPANTDPDKSINARLLVSPYMFHYGIAILLCLVSWMRC